MQSVLGNSGTVQGQPTDRDVIFFVSPRIIDFDAFLPTAMELKRQMPNWRIRFVTFSRENFDFIAHNATHCEALSRTGTLHYLGWEDGGTLLARIWLRLRALLTVIGWLLRHDRPLILLGLPFTAEPYALWRAIARIRRGRAITLWKYRSPDMVLYRLRKVRQKPPAGHPPSMIARMFAKDADLFVHYHDSEETNIEWARPYGRLDNVPEMLIGMPHWLPAWRDMIDDEVAQARRDLVADGLPPDAEYYAMFPAKIWSAETLRDDEAVVWTFVQACRLIARLRPKAVILMRPHPKAIEVPYYKEMLAELGPDHARISWLHPEVLLELSHRAIFNNPTNILFSCYKGRFIDVSDYHPDHYDEFGERSLADGYGPVYLNPRAADFETQFARVLQDDTLYDNTELTRNQDALLQRNPADVSRLLQWANDI